MTKGKFPNGLAEAMAHAGVGATELARQLRTSKQNVARWSAGERRLTPEWAKKIGPVLGTTPERLLLISAGARLVETFDPDEPEGAEGDFRPDNGPGVSTDHVYHGEVPGSSPVIDTRAGAGPGSLALPALNPSGGVIYSEDAIVGEILLPEYLQMELSRAPAGRIHWVRVRGDSMEPTFKGGDHVAVDTTDSSIGQGGVFVARNGDGEILVKRFYRVPKSDPPQIEIRSDNESVEPTRTVDADWINIIGRVVAKIARIG